MLPVGSTRPALQVRIAGGENLATHQDVPAGVEHKPGVRRTHGIVEAFAFDGHGPIDADVVAIQLHQPLCGDVGAEVVDLAAAMWRMPAAGPAPLAVRCTCEYGAGRS